MLDLIRQSAAAHGEDCEPDPAEWFQSKFGREPDCSRTRPGFWMYRRSTARDSWHALAGTDRAIVDQQAIQEENGAVMAHQHRKLLSPSEKKKVDEINARMEARRQQWEKGRREGTSDSFWGYTEPLNPDAPGPAKEPLG
jgi:hypothetical protein